MSATPELRAHRQPRPAAGRLVVAVTGHEIRRALPGVLVLSGGLAALTVVALAIGSGLQDDLASLTDDLPEALLAFIPGDVPGGYVVGEVVNLIAPVALVAWAVLGAARVVAGEERDGTMSVLASLPLSRSALLGAKALALVTGLLMITLVLLAALAASAAGFDLGLSTGNAAATMVHLFLLALVLGGLAFAVGAVSGSPTLASAVAGAVAVVAYLTDAMLPLAGLDGLARTSPWYYYASSTPLAHGLDLPHVAVLGGLSVLVAVVAFVGYPRRDLEV